MGASSGLAKNQHAWLFRKQPSHCILAEAPHLSDLGDRKNAFEEIVWKSPGTGQRSYASQLARTGWSAYREAWTHFLKIIYTDHFHPTADKWLRDLLLTLDHEADLKKLASAGRRKETEAERASLLRRYRALLRWCEDLHKAIDSYSRKGLRQREIRECIFRKIHGDRGDGLVLSGKAFNEIPTKKGIKMHDAKSWEPRDLAIALLAHERSRQYDTIKKKIRTRTKSIP